MKNQPTNYGKKNKKLYFWHWPALIAVVEKPCKISRRLLFGCVGHIIQVKDCIRSNVSVKNSELEHSIMEMQIKVSKYGCAFLD